MSKPARHNGTAEVPPGPVQGDEDEDPRPVSLLDLEGLRGSLLKARAIAVFAGAADPGELRLDEPGKEPLSQLMELLIEQLDDAEQVLDDYLEAAHARRKGTTRP